jgi:hypothetical protein
MVIAMKTSICDMIIIKLFTWLTNLFQSYGIKKIGSRYYKFDKAKKSFQSFLKYIFIFLVHHDVYFFGTNLLQGHVIRNKKV